MQHQDQTLSTQASSTPQAPTAMQVLSLDEMRAVAGGPEIKNGGSSTGSPATADATSTGTGG